MIPTGPAGKELLLEITLLRPDFQGGTTKAIKRAWKMRQALADNEPIDTQPQVLQAAE